MKKTLLILLTLLCSIGMWAQDSETIASASFDGKAESYTEGWTTTGTGKTRNDCIVIGADENITSPAFNLSQYAEVTISFQARRYGTLEGSKATIDASIAGTSLGTTDATGTSATNSAGSITFNPTSSMTAAKIVFTCTNATSAGSTHGAGIHTITITGRKPSTEPYFGDINPVKLTASATSGSFNYTIGNPDGSTLSASTEASWISNIVCGADEVTFDVEPNTGNARETVITLTYGTLTKDVTVSQEKFVLDFATLPMVVDFGVSSADLKKENGVTLVCDGTDYNNADCKVKFSKNTHYLQIKTAESIGECTFNVRGCAGAGSSSFKLMESKDGENWTEVETLVATFAKKDEDVVLTSTKSFDEESRYLKLAFQKATGEVNCGLGAFTINKVAAPEIPTFASLEALIAANQSYDAVNVTIDDEVYIATADPDMSGIYAVWLKNSRVMLASPGDNLEWKTGGKVKGTLTNVQWINDFNKELDVKGALRSKESFWSALTYTEPEAIPFNSIDELLEAGLETGTLVTVNIEGTIKEAEYNANHKTYSVLLDNDFQISSLAHDYGWVAGGTISGIVENVAFVNEQGDIAIISMDPNQDIFAGLTYTAPAKGTLNFVASNNDGYWATFSSTKDVIFDANDVIVYTVAADGDDLVMVEADDNSLSCVTDKSKDDGWVAGYYVQAGAGVLVNSADESVNYYYTTTDPYTENILTEIETAPEYNMLRPASAAKEPTGYVFYKLAYASEAKDALGFYWGAADGAAFKSRYGSAYLAVPASQTSAKGFAFDSESTGIKSVETSNSKAPAYNIAGQRVNANVKGIVIMNGKKYINK